MKGLISDEEKKEMKKLKELINSINEMDDYKKALLKIQKLNVPAQNFLKDKIIWAWKELLNDVMNNKINKEDFKKYMSRIVLFPSMLYDVLELIRDK